MLIKLIKYEFKATWRKLLPIYGILIAFSIINKLARGLESVTGSSDMISTISVPVKGITVFLQAAAIIGVVAVTLYVILERFYKSFYGDEGYLTFTLPVSPWKHLTSKLTVSVFWALVSVIIGVVSLLISYYDDGILKVITGNYVDIIGGSNSVYENIVINFYVFYGINIISVSKLTLAALFAGLIFEILMIYLSISIGHLFFKNKKLSSFGAYLILSTVTRIISFVTTFLIGFINEEQWLTANSYNNGIKILLVVALGTSVILAIICWTVLEEIINKKLNLE